MKYRQLIALSIGLLMDLPVAAQAPPQDPASARARELSGMQTALAATGANAEAWMILAVEYDRLVTENPRNPEVRVARGDFRWEREEHRAAVEDWEAALHLEPGHAGALIGLGGAAVVGGEIVKAAALHRQAVSARPEHPVAHFALANVLYLFRHELCDASHPDEQSVMRSALTHYAEASRLAPASAEYARAYAESFYGLSKPDWEEARKAWERVRDLSPAKGFAWINLARIDLQLRRYDSAQTCLDEVQGPDFQQVKARLEKQLKTQTERHHSTVRE